MHATNINSSGEDFGAAPSETRWLDRFWRAARRQLVWLLLAALLAGTAASVITGLQPTRFVTGTSFVIQTSANRGESETLVRTIESLITSEAVARDVLVSTDVPLAEYEVTEAIAVSRAPGSGFLSVSITTEDEQHSELLAAGLGPAFEARLADLTDAGDVSAGYTVEEWGEISETFVISPPTTRNGVLGFGLGLGAAMLVILLRAQGRPPVHTASEAGEAFGMPVVAALPRFTSGKGGWTRIDAAQSLRSTGLVSRLERGDILAVTGPGDETERAELALALAGAIVLNGSRVVLIDADLESGVLTGRLKARRNHGLSDGLSRTQSADDQLLTIDPVALVRVADGAKRALAFLPVGRRRDKRLLTGPELGAILTDFARGAVVVVAGPPLPGPVPSGQLLSAADVILVAAVERTTITTDARLAGSVIASLASGRTGVVLLDSSRPYFESPTQTNHPVPVAPR